MERVSGVNNWTLRCRREGAGVTILRAATCDETAALPETVWGLPVTALGEHALAPGAWKEEGEEVRVVCGPPGGEPDWDNGRLRELRLPAALERVGNYALFRCGALKTLRLSDRTRHWGGGALMNCRSLDTFYLHGSGREGEVLSYLAGELSRELDVTLTTGDGETVRLIFPEYQEIYEENCPAHHFDYTIAGAGYPYHHCFRQKRLYLKEYDQLWPGYLGMEHDPACALKLALCRLRWPRELTEQAAGRYLTYLRDNAAAALEGALAARDMEGLAFLLDRTAPSRTALAAALETARQAGAAEAVALLLETRHQRFPGGPGKTFDL